MLPHKFRSLFTSNPKDKNAYPTITLTRQTTGLDVFLPFALPQSAMVRNPNNIKIKPTGTKIELVVDQSASSTGPEVPLRGVTVGMAAFNGGGFWLSFLVKMNKEVVEAGGNEEEIIHVPAEWAKMNWMLGVLVSRMQRQNLKYDPNMLQPTLPASHRTDPWRQLPHFDDVIYVPNPYQDDDSDDDDNS